MSVGDEQTECPLCMEPLELDDINFFPCTCGYQICRFCWHRIRTDENGLCPACRKQYPEDPAEFRPLTDDELQRIKKERRQKEVQRKQKAAENRKHLANVRVVQKNLVFVVGLSQRLAEVETLKKHEYFGKFGKIHKVVINQSTSYAGAQGPSASAYVTYHRPEDALRAIQAVNNIHVEGRTLKASLGTTKYCSHFLRGAQCPKPDCMYLHELGEEAASFTKDEMQQGKHQEYEQKLYELYMNSQNSANTLVEDLVNSGAEEDFEDQAINGATPPPQSSQPSLPNRSKADSPTDHSEQNMDAWPTLNTKGDRLKSDTTAQDQIELTSRAPGFHRNLDAVNSQSSANDVLSSNLSCSIHMQSHTNPSFSSNLSKSNTAEHHNGHQGSNHVQSQLRRGSIGTSRRSPFENPVDSMSLFSSTNGFPSSRNPKPVQNSQSIDNLPTSTEIPETIPVSSSTDWQAAFGFKPTSNNHHLEHMQQPEDDLGFDPWNESAKALADMIEKESGPQPSKDSSVPNTNVHSLDSNRPKNLPPGFAANHLGAFPNTPGQRNSGSKILGLMQIQPSGANIGMAPLDSGHDLLSDSMGKTDNQQNHDVFNTKDWQDGLRALLPNINISFGAPNHGNHTLPMPYSRVTPQNTRNTHHSLKSWPPTPNSEELSWDPAIVTSGNVSEGNAHSSEEPPHWMASLQHLTEESNSHRMPFVRQFQLQGGMSGWNSQSPSASHPPPGFHQSQIRPHSQISTESQKIESLQ